MSSHESTYDLTVDEIIVEAIRREQHLRKFYEKALDDVGPDAKPTISYLCNQHASRIRRLEELAVELDALRELTASIAD
jgi:hypothetical protein